MSTFFKDEEANKVLHQFFHANFGKKAGLLSHEYMVHFDPDLREDFDPERYEKSNSPLIDYKIFAGPTIHIFLRSLPSEEYMPRTMKLLRHAFIENPIRLREFLRSNAIVRKSDAVKWFCLEVSGAEIDASAEQTRDISNGLVNKRKVSVNNFTQESIMSLRVRDKKTHKTVIVKVVNGDTFSAQEKALKILYGDRLE